MSGAVADEAPRGSLPRLLALALITACGLLTANIMPAFVTGLEKTLGFTPAQAAMTGSANIYGAAIGSVMIALVGMRWAMSRMGAAALALMITIDLLSSTVRSFETLVALRTCHGIAGGMLMGVGYSAIARTAAPDRGFGLLLVMQFGLGGLGIAVLPGQLAAFGTAALFVPLAGAGILAIALLGALRDLDGAMPLQDRTSDQKAGGALATSSAFAALILFQASHMALAAFLLDLGHAAGLDPAFVSGATGASSLIGIVGSIAMVWLGLRAGRLKPLAVGMGVAGISCLLLLFAALPVGFVGALMLGGIGWTFAVPYLLGLCATLAPRRSPLWTSCASKLGLATGPLLGAAAMTGGYHILIGVAFIGTCLSAFAMIIPAWLSDRVTSSA